MFLGEAKKVLFMDISVNRRTPPAFPHGLADLSEKVGVLISFFYMRTSWFHTVWNGWICKDKKITNNLRPVEH